MYTINKKVKNRRKSVFDQILHLEVQIKKNFHLKMKASQIIAKVNKVSPRQQIK